MVKNVRNSLGKNKSDGLRTYKKVTRKKKSKNRKRTHKNFKKRSNIKRQSGGAEANDQLKARIIGDFLSKMKDETFTYQGDDALMHAQQDLIGFSHYLIFNEDPPFVFLKGSNQQHQLKVDRSETLGEIDRRLKLLGETEENLTEVEAVNNPSGSDPDLALMNLTEFYSERIEKLKVLLETINKRMRDSWGMHDISDGFIQKAKKVIKDFLTNIRDRGLSPSWADRHILDIIESQWSISQVLDERFQIKSIIADAIEKLEEKIYEILSHEDGALEELKQIITQDRPDLNGLLIHFDEAVARGAKQKEAVSRIQTATRTRQALKASQLPGALQEAAAAQEEADAVRKEAAAAQEAIAAAQEAIAAAQEEAAAARKEAAALQAKADAERKATDATLMGLRGQMEELQEERDQLAEESGKKSGKRSLLTPAAFSLKKATEEGASED